MTLQNVYAEDQRKVWWEIQSIDTMKYSRDLAREKKNDSNFLLVIDTQVKNIAQTGATHIAIGTPYDEEFLPYLKDWIAAARKYNLNVWFRGNWSGWEKWFGYLPIDRDQHIAKTKEFITKNNELFRSGDIFSACPECENGGPGDPRLNGDLQGHRKFLIDEYKMTSETFRLLGLNVKSNFSPMNADVAKVVMDEDTTKALGGIVVIDHYVKYPDQLAKDIKDIATTSKGKIFLGEFGAPIPDIHGKLNDQQQSAWIENAFKDIYQINELIGINYWVNIGGTTQIWDENNNPTQAVNVISAYFQPNISTIKLINEIGKPITNATIMYVDNKVKGNENGNYVVKYIGDAAELKINADTYKDEKILVSKNDENPIIELTKKRENLWFRFRKAIYKTFGI